MKKIIYYLICITLFLCISGNVYAAEENKDKLIWIEGASISNNYYTEDLTYPNKPGGWKGGSYYRRQLKKTRGSKYLKISGSRIVAKSKMWTEFEANGKELSYYNTGAIALSATNGDYDVAVTFENPTKSSYQVFIRGNDMLQSTAVKVKPGKTCTVKVRISVVYSKMELSFVVPQTAKNSGNASWKTVYIKSLKIKKREKEKMGKIPTIYVAGDSTASTRTSSVYPYEGWAQELYRYIQHKGPVKVSRKRSIGYNWYEYKMDTAIIENRSATGQSTNTFRTTGKFDAILNQVKPGDYVLVQFGHNDANDFSEPLSTPISQFKSNLSYLARGCRQRGAICILTSAIPRWDFDQTGRIKSTAIEYRKAMKQVASAEKAVFVDVGGAVDIFMTNIGKESARQFYMVFGSGIYANYPNGLHDKTHLNKKGAIKVTQIMANEMKKNKSLGKLANMIQCDSDYYRGLKKIR